MSGAICISRCTRDRRARTTPRRFRRLISVSNFAGAPRNPGTSSVVHSRQIKAKLIDQRRVKICGLAHQPAAGRLEAERCSLLAPFNGNIDAAAERFASEVLQVDGPPRLVIGALF